jgi:pimeloyl-ACP methyl ester carboxylesterase
MLNDRVIASVLTLGLAAILSCGGGDNNPVGPPDIGEPVAAGCSNGLLPSGPLYRICFPANWNGILVVYAHGYVEPLAPIALPNDVIGGQSIEATVTGMGYGYATTSYRHNGLVAAEAVQDVSDLQLQVRKLFRPDPVKSVIVGVSEGGLVAVLAVEQSLQVFDGALALCGPVGSLRAELDYLDDFRVVFDYLFPGVIPGSPIQVPAEVTNHWDDRYAPAVAAAILLRPDAARELIAITGAPVASQSPADIAVTAVSVLWYNVIGSTDVQARLGGNPYDNTTRVYSGSSNDAALNASIARFTANPTALAPLEAYETGGSLLKPVVTLHTTGDPIVPVEQESRYAVKVRQNVPAAFLDQTAVSRYGHCAFQATEVLGAFSTLMGKVSPP